MTSPNEAEQLDRAWWRDAGIEACMDRMEEIYAHNRNLQVKLADEQDKYQGSLIRIDNMKMESLRSATASSDTAKQGWEQECKDGDRILALFPHLQRTEGGWLPVAKIVNEISELAARCKRAEATAPQLVTIGADAAGVGSSADLPHWAEQEPVAWRYKTTDDQNHWRYVASAPARSDARDIESLYPLPSLLPATQRSEPVAWIEHHKGGDNLNWERVDHPYAKATPLYAAPISEKQAMVLAPTATGTGKVFDTPSEGQNAAGQVSSREQMPEQSGKRPVPAAPSPDNEESKDGR